MPDLSFLPPQLKAKVQDLFNQSAGLISSGTSTPSMQANISNQIKKLANSFDATGKTFDEVRKELIKFKSSVTSATIKGFPKRSSITPGTDPSGLGLYTPITEEQRQLKQIQNAFYLESLDRQKKDAIKYALQNRFAPGLFSPPPGKGVLGSNVLSNADMDYKQLMGEFYVPTASETNKTFQRNLAAARLAKNKQDTISNANRASFFAPGADKEMVRASRIQERLEKDRKRAEDKRIREEYEFEQAAIENRARLEAENLLNQRDNQKRLIARQTKLSQTTESAYSIGNIFNFNKIAKDLQAQGLQPQEISALKTRVRERNQNRAFGLSLVAPLASSVLEQAIGTQTRGARIGSSAVSALGNVVGLGATGFSIGGPIGAGVGAAVGLASSVPSIIDAITSNLPELTKELQKLGEASSKSRESLAGFTESTQKLALINSGDIAYRPQDRQRLLLQQTASISSVGSPVIRGKIEKALAEGNIQEAISAFSNASQLTKQNESSIELAAKVATNSGDIYNPYTSALRRAGQLVFSNKYSIPENQLSKKQTDLISETTTGLFKLIGSSVTEGGDSLLGKIDSSKAITSRLQGANSIGDFAAVLNQVGRIN
ncbi:MAG: hypothetical protein EKK57_07535, partial [Proteobacteria bacterium]